MPKLDQFPSKNRKEGQEYRKKGMDREAEKNVVPLFLVNQ